MRKSLVVGVVTLACTGVVAWQAWAQSPPTEVQPGNVMPTSGHLEVMLATHDGLRLDDGALARVLPVLREPGFLERAAPVTADPLAPCALLTAALSSDMLNRMFFGLARPGGYDFRVPAGTHLLGLYDRQLAQARGAIPRDDPALAADMLARSVVWRSWNVSTLMNSMLSTMNQGQCVARLVQPMLLKDDIAAAVRRPAVMAHAAPVSAHILSIDKTHGQPWLDALLAPGMLDQTARRPSDNPLAPCALLGTFRLAARLNDAWGHALPAGRFDPAGHAELAPYAETLKAPLDPADAGTAEVLAAVFDAEIRRANELTDQLTAGATQRECLDELFAPGGLRLKLMRAGKSLPLR